MLLRSLSPATTAYRRPLILQAQNVAELEKAIDAARRIEHSSSLLRMNRLRLRQYSRKPHSVCLSQHRAIQNNLPSQQQRSCWICGHTQHSARDCPQRPAKKNKKPPEICRNFNRLLSRIEQANNMLAGRLHKCSQCHKWGVSSSPQELPTQSLGGIPPSNEPSDSEFPPSSSTQEQVIFAYPLLPTLGVHSKSAISSGLLLSPLERNFPTSGQCCSVSLSQLHAIGTMEIPIQWNNGKETTFQMLVVPGLSWPILFGENHLHSTQALVDHAAPSIHFRHPSMSFKITCSLQNPLTEASPKATPAGVTCLLTGAPFPGHN
ncbi:hypothetical protein ACROYT_G023884 [Oculina patagonica]